MIHTFKNFALYKLKKLECFLRVKRNNRSIAKAYNSRNTIQNANIQTKKIVYYISGVCVFCLLCIAGYYAYNKVSHIYSKFTTEKFKNVLKTNSQRIWNQTPHKIQTPPDISPKDKEITTSSLEEKSTPSPKPVTADAKSLIKEPYRQPIDRLNSNDIGLLNVAYPFTACLVANKATHTLYMAQKTNNIWIVSKQFRIATGEQSGRKTKAGDKKTPEGIYFIVGRKNQPEVENIYGPLVYVLNYPNDEDQQEHRTGQGIWIHGTAPDSTPFQTSGCLEMNNSDIIFLSTILKNGIGTPVVIVNEPDLEDPLTILDFDLLDSGRERILFSYVEKRNIAEKFLEEWILSWKSRNIAEYEKFYSLSSFESNGMRWPQWRAKKMAIFSRSRSIEIVVSDMNMTDFSESTIAVKFIQRYDSEDIRSENGKQLNLIRERDSWKIAGERTFPKEELTL